jgi:menaquinol-cytochrome c reductase iron-sulfur subunit
MSDPKTPEGSEKKEEKSEEARAPDDAHTLARREVLAKASMAMGVAGGAALGLPLVGFVVAPLTKSAPAEWRAVGAVTGFEIGATVPVTFIDTSPLPWAGVTAKTAAWLRRVSDTEFVAFSVNCAHLGCPVRWLPQASLFMCPCHGGVYYQDGKVAAGPPPHPLSQYPVRLNNGIVEVLAEPIPIG